MAEDGGAELKIWRMYTMGIKYLSAFIYFFSDLGFVLTQMEIPLCISVLLACAIGDVGRRCGGCVR